MKFTLSTFQNFSLALEFINGLSYDQQKHMKVFTDNDCIFVLHPEFVSEFPEVRQ